MLLQIPEVHPGEEQGQTVKFEDLSAKDAVHLIQVVQFLCTEEAEDYIMELECFFSRRLSDAHQNAEQGMVSWSATWTKAVSVAVSRLRNRSDLDQGGQATEESNDVILKALPAIKALLKNTFPGQPKAPEGIEQQGSGSGQTATSGALSSPADIDEAPTILDIYTIKNMGNDKLNVDILDIMAIQGQLEAHFMSWAASLPERGFASVVLSWIRCVKS